MIRRQRIDKSILAIGTPRRDRDKKHLAFVAGLPCFVCGYQGDGVVGHHLMTAQPRAKGLKVSDEYVIPLCNEHHNGLHLLGDETKFFNSHGFLLPEALWFAKGLWAGRGH
jgi:hypothetical protein